MAFEYTGYAVFPGRQHYVVMIPEKFPHLFLEGVQSIDSNPNTEDTEYGQYGFSDPIIVEKAFKNETGTIAINHYGYAQRVLRAMAGQDPDSSFLYDKSYNGKVDFWENVYNKKRDKVVHSRYWFDAVMSTSHSSTLDGVETYSMDFTATRCLEFDAKQISTQSFVTEADGQRQFSLQAPAIIDPVLNDIRAYNPASGGVTLGDMRHELCPIQYALRVWVDGIIVKDPDAAMIFTESVPVPTPAGQPQQYNLESTLFLKEPVKKAGQIVKVAWLVDGNAYVSQTGISTAPLMVVAEPNITVGTPSVFNDEITVRLSRTLSDASIANLLSAANPEFELHYEDAGVAFIADAITVAVDNAPDPTAPYTSFLATGNVLTLTFGNIRNALTNAPATNVWGPGEEAILQYIGDSMVGEDKPSSTAIIGQVSPSHKLDIPAFV